MTNQILEENGTYHWEIVIWATLSSLEQVKQLAEQQLVPGTPYTIRNVEARTKFYTAGEGNGDVPSTD